MSAELRRDSARLWVEAYLEDLTSHGLSRITATASYLQQCSILVAQYRKNDVDVSVDFSFNKEVDFPAVTICNLNALRRQEVLKTRLHEHVNVTASPTTVSAAPVTVTTAAPTTTPTTPYVSTVNPRDFEANVTLPSTATRTVHTTVFVEPGTEAPLITTATLGETEPTLATQTTGMPNIAPTTAGDGSGGSRTTPRPHATTASGGGTHAPATGPPVPGGGTTESSQGVCIIAGVPVTLTLGLPCSVMKLLLGEGAAAGGPANQDGSAITRAPTVAGFIPDDFFTSSTTPDTKTASDAVLEIADSFEGGNTSLFAHVETERNRYNLQKVDLTSHQVNYQYDEAPVVREEISVLGHQIEDMLFRCRYDSEGCSPSNFTQFQNGRYGNCYTFNGDEARVLRTERVGPTYGLLMELDIEQSLNYIGQLTQSAGIRMVIHRQGEQAFPEYDGFDLAPGFKTYVGIRQVVIERQGRPYGNCQEGNPQEELASSNATTYTKWGCLRECLAEHMLRECKCVDATYIDKDARLCHAYNHPEQANCLAEVDRQFKTDLICQDCEDPCRSVIFRKSISSERWPSKQYEPALFARLAEENRTIDDDVVTAKIRDNYIQAVVYFEEFNFQTVTQRPALEIVDLLSYIGGTIGLFVGVSALSILEFLDIIVNLVYFFAKWLYKRVRTRLLGDDVFDGDERELQRRTSDVKAGLYY
ncbi:amiloride-sensitive sodium channel subunit beta-like isoform X2 [Sycon ciliatum]|uniref:amiloride-sensitive sodium channel subunit beta-like isoform X2 n=1 Tax=Sycon ciliatum TaxID=27933 RepID=UPI0031F67C55